MTQLSSSRASRRRGRLPRLALAAALVLAVSAVLAVLAAYAWIRHYLASEDFRSLLATQSGQILGAEVSIDPLVWDRLAVRTPSVKATGSGRITRLEVFDPQATISLGALTSGTWVVENARIERLVADLKAPASSTPGPLPPSTDGPQPAEDVDAAAFAPTGLPSWFPTKVRVPQIQIREASLRFGQGDMDFRILQTGVLLTWLDESSHDADVRGGTFRLAPFPGAGIDHKGFEIIDAKMRLTPEKIFLLDSRLKSPDGTTLTITGNLPGPRSSDALDVQYSMEGLPVAQVLGGEWTNRIFGRLSILGQSTGSDDAIIHTGTAELADARFLTPPPAPSPADPGPLGLVTHGWQSFSNAFIPILGAYTDRSVQFRNLVCDAARCRYRKEGDRISLTDIHIRSRALLGIDGTLDILGRDLNGRLMVGVSRETLSGIPGAETKVFTIERDGLVWAPVHLTGTLDDPKEDLTQRLIDAAGDRILEELPTLESLRATLEKVAPGPLLDGANGVLDGGGKLLDEGTRLLDGMLPVPK